MASRRATPSRSPVALPLKNTVYTVAISWDCVHGRGVDLDLQAVIVDANGFIIDAVYYNNLTALNQAVSLSGDEVTGAAEGYDESMYVLIPSLPAQVKLIVFVVAVYDEGRLRDAIDGKIVIQQDGCQVQVFNIERSGGDADVVAMMKQGPGGRWTLYGVDEPAEIGSHFLDILEPNIGDIIRREIPGAPAYQKVSFIMEKGSVASLPQAMALKRLSIGIGGSLPRRVRKTVDIDISAVFYSKNGHLIGAVDCDHDEMYGVSHSGDEKIKRTDGTARGDDECITIDLLQIPSKVNRIFLVLTIADGTFESVESAYARIVDQGGAELVRYDIEGGRPESALIIAQLLRSPGKRWGFQAAGAFMCGTGRSWRGATDGMEEIIRETQGWQPVDPNVLQEEGDFDPPRLPSLVEDAEAAVIEERQHSVIRDASKFSIAGGNRSSTAGSGRSTEIMRGTSRRSTRSLGRCTLRRSTSTCITAAGKRVTQATPTRQTLKRGTLRLMSFSAGEFAAMKLPDDTDTVSVDGGEDQDTRSKARACGPCGWAKRASFLGACGGVVG